MSKFKVGDKVKIVKFQSFPVTAWTGVTGTVCAVAANSAWDYLVNLDDDYKAIGFDEDELELVQ